MESEQLDMFPHHGTPSIQRCGNCVVFCRRQNDRNIGDCSRVGWVHKDSPRCPNWFGVDALRRSMERGKDRWQKLTAQAKT